MRSEGGDRVRRWFAHPLRLPPCSTMVVWSSCVSFFCFGPFLARLRQRTRRTRRKSNKKEQTKKKRRSKEVKYVHEYVLSSVEYLSRPRGGGEDQSRAKNRRSDTASGATT